MLTHELIEDAHFYYDKEIKSIVAISKSAKIVVGVISDKVAPDCVNLLCSAPMLYQALTQMNQALENFQTISEEYNIAELRDIAIAMQNINMLAQKVAIDGNEKVSEELRIHHKMQKGKIL